MFKWLLVGVFFLTACSKNENKSIPEQIIYYEAGVGITTTSGDFGDVSPTSSKVVTYSIKNTGDAPLMGPPSIDNSNFSIIYQNGCASVAPNKSCSVKVAFDAKGKTPGVYESNLNLDSFFLELTAEIPAPIAPAPEVIQVQYQPSSNGSAITEMDFGTLQGNQSATKTFYIKNVSTITLNQAVSFPSNYIVSYDMCSNRVVGIGKSCMIKVTLSAQGKSGNQDASLSYAGASFSLKGSIQATELPPAVTPVLDVDYLVSNQIVTTVDYGEISPTGSKLVSINLKNTGNVTLNESVVLTGEYDLIYDTCSSKAIGVNKTCQVRVSLSGAGKSGAVVGNVSFAGQNLSLTGFVATPQTPSPTLFPEIVYLNGTSEVSVVDMGFFPYGSSQQLILNIKNKGTLADVAKTASLNNANFSIGYNQCINKALAVNESCQIRVIFAANGKPEGTYTSILSFGEQSLSLTAFAGNALITYSPIYSDYGSCSVNAVCQGLGTKSRTMTGCQKLANGAPIEGAVLSDCTSFDVVENLQSSCPSPAGEKLVEIDNGDKTVSCDEGLTTENFVSVACDNEYSPSGELCVGTACSLENAEGNGISSILEVATVSGTINNDSCSVETCNMFYNNNTSSCAPKECNQLNSEELTSLSYNLSGATLSGTYPSCSISCASSYQQPAGDGKSCEDKVVTGTSFVVDNVGSGTVYTNQLSVVVDSSSIINAQQMALDWSSCSLNAASFEAFSPSKSFTVTAPLNASKTLSIKYKNGNQEICLTRTIVHDTIAPTIPSSLTESGDAKNGTTPSFSWGTSSDVNGGINYEIALGTSLAGAELLAYTSTNTSRSYAPTTISSLQDTTYYAKVRAKDRAGNYSGDRTVSWYHMLGNSRMEKVVSGVNFSCALKNSDVYCWGSNSFTELGSSDPGEGSTLPVKVNVGVPVLDIAAGGGVACAITSPNRGLKCWGQNFNGQVGKGTTGTQGEPVSDVLNMASGVSQVTVGYSHTCAIKDAVAYCWGSNANGRLGRGVINTTNYGTPQQVCATGTACAAASYFKNVTAISAGGAHTCAIANLGQGYCWGMNTTGQVGDATVIDKSNPVALAAVGGSANNFSKISAGSGHTCAIRFAQVSSEGYSSLYCWGSQIHGALGNSVTSGNITAAASGVRPTGFDTNVSEVWAGATRTCAIKDTDLYCWGNNSRGEIGDSSIVTTPVLTPTRPKYANSTYFRSVTSFGMATFSDVTTLPSIMCALDAGTVSCWGSNGPTFATYSTVGDENTPAEISNNVRVPFQTPGLSGVTITKIASEFSNVCVIVNGALKCIGDNSVMQLGNASFTDASYSTPVIPTGMDYGVTDVYLRPEGACAVKGMQLYCWGKQRYNYLGNGVANNTIQSTPSSPTGLTRDIVSVTFDSKYASLACVSQGGLAKCWGFLGGAYCNVSEGWPVNQFGTGDCVLTNSTPKKVCGIGSTGASPSCAGLYNVSKIHTNGYSTCAIVQGQPSCWGEDYPATTGYGQRPVYLTNWTAQGGISDIHAQGAGPICIKYGENRACAVGSNTNYLYGTTGAFRQTIPNPVPADIVNYATPLSSQLFTSGDYNGAATCGVDGSGAVKCWGIDVVGYGSSYFGIFATGTIDQTRKLPTQIGMLTKSKLVHIGSSVACAENNGAVFCWSYKNHVGTNAIFQNVGIPTSETPVMMNFGF